MSHGDARRCVEERLTPQVLRVDPIVEPKRMKLNRSRRDGSILGRPTSPRVPSEDLAVAQGALGLTGLVSIAHIESPLYAPHRAELRLLTGVRQGGEKNKPRKITEKLSAWFIGLRE